MSCLFRSLAYYVDNLDTESLRQKICDYMEKNPCIIDDIPINLITEWTHGSSLQQYIKKMRLSSTWGTGVEIKCFCDMLGVYVNVHHNNRVIEFIPRKLYVNKVIQLRYNGNHYEHM